MITKPIIIGPTNSRTVRAFLIPDLALKHSAGSYATRKIIKQLRDALAVHALLTLEALLALGEERSDAQEIVEKAAGKTWGWLSKVGRTNLSELTRFRDAQQARLWAVGKIKRMRAEGAIGFDRDKAIESELEAVRLLSFAEHWAEKIVRAFEDVQRLQEAARRRGIDVASDNTIQKAAHQRIQEVMNESGWDRPISDLLQIAMYADINPSCLWMSTGDLFGTLFEVARFVGGIHAGREASLPSNCHRLIRYLFGDGQVYDFKSGQVAADVLRYHLKRLFDPQEFLACVSEADERRWLLVVTARRELVLVEPPPPPQILPRRTQRFLDRLAEKCREFFRLNPTYRQEGGS